MSTAKRFYTHKKLTHRSTAQLMAIYNRLFNTNIWDEVFNPYENRQEILMALFAEMQAYEALQRLNEQEASGQAIPRYQGMKIQFTPEGMVFQWVSAFINPAISATRKVDHDIVREVKRMYAEGISQRAICREFNLKPSRVFRIIKGWVYAEVSV